MGAPRARRTRRQIFGKTVDYVLKNAPCRVMVAAGQKRGGVSPYRLAVTRVSALLFVGLGIACSSSRRARRRRRRLPRSASLFIALGVGRLYLLRSRR